MLKIVLASASDTFGTLITKFSFLLDSKILTLKQQIIHNSN